MIDRSPAATGKLASPRAPSVQGQAPARTRKYTASGRWSTAFFARLPQRGTSDALVAVLAPEWCCGTAAGRAVTIHLRAAGARIR